MNEKLPKAYKLGHQDFYGYDFEVSSQVLIPRPETEAIIDVVLNLAGKPYLPGVLPSAQQFPEDFRVLDVGTGSGCIAITLKLKLEKARVTACDISDEALKVAKKNAENLGAKVNFMKSDLTERTGVDYDVIIANLPYVDENWDWLDKESLGYEPSLALYAEDGGLFLIKKLIREVTEASAQESSGKFLILEADPCQHEEIKKYALEHNLEHKETRGFALLFRIGS